MAWYLEIACKGFKKSKGIYNMIYAPTTTFTLKIKPGSNCQTERATDLYSPRAVNLPWHSSSSLLVSCLPSSSIGPYMGNPSKAMPAVGVIPSKSGKRSVKEAKDRRI